jgi:hypothetical protein
MKGVLHFLEDLHDLIISFKVCRRHMCVLDLAIWTLNAYPEVLCLILLAGEAKQAEGVPAGQKLRQAHIYIKWFVAHATLRGGLG